MKFLLAVCCVLLLALAGGVVVARAEDPAFAALYYGVGVFIGLILPIKFRRRQ